MRARHDGVAVTERTVVVCRDKYKDDEQYQLKFKTQRPQVPFHD